MTSLVKQKDRYRSMYTSMQNYQEDQPETAHPTQPSMGEMYFQSVRFCREPQQDSKPSTSFMKTVFTFLDIKTHTALPQCLSIQFHLTCEKNR